jgi:HIP---CoA ligase
VSNGSPAGSNDILIADTIGRLVPAAAEAFGDIEALVDGNFRLTFHDLRWHVQDAASSFVAAGLDRGDCVAIWAPNSAEWVIAALAVSAAGGILVPLNTRFKGAEAADILERTDATFLLCENFLGSEPMEMLRQTGVELSALRQIITLRGPAQRGTTSWQSFCDLGDSKSENEALRRIDGGSSLGTSDIIFTSGTTGRPKGAMCSHLQTLRVFHEWSGIVGLEQRDRYLIVNPFFHTFGYKAGILACLLRGATVLPMPTFDLDSVMQLVETERISMLPGPPTIFLTMLDSANRQRFDLSSLRLAVTGAAAVPVEMIRRMREELTFRVIVTGYGLTESTGVISMCRPQDDPETIATTSGRPIADIEVRVVDENGTEVPRGTPGEIVCRGYNVMQGYLGDDAATAEAIDATGWLHTGDVGVMNGDGYLTITDRIKDMFIVGGFNAYPAEIENMLLAHPAIANVAVVGVPDARMGEVGHAFVVPRAGHIVDAAAVIEWARDRMANFKVPRAVHVVDVLPTNASGKVLKFELRRQASE